MRLKSIEKIEDIIIGTSLNKKDDELCDWMKKKNIIVRHSPEDDLLGRVHQVSESNHFDYLVKLMLIVHLWILYYSKTLYIKSVDQK